MKHNFKFFIKEGAGNMFSHGFMSFAAVGVTVACLLIMGTFTLVAYNAGVCGRFTDGEGGQSPTDEAGKGGQRGGLHVHVPRRG